MHLFILVFWYFDCIVKTRSEEALLFDLKNKHLDDIKLHQNLNSKSSLLTACPSSTERERQFNDEISITGNGVFLRKVHQDDVFIRNIPIDICDKPLKPAEVFDSKNNETLIGYELYYEEGKVSLECDKYDAYKSQKEHKINNKNETTPKPLIIKYRDRYHTKFRFANESSALVFHWIPVLSIKSISNHQKRIYFKDVNIVKFNDRPSRDKCENYNPKNNSIDSLYSEENQAKSLKDIFTSSNSSQNTTNTKFACGNPYGCLEKTQIIPIWYFNSSSAKLASCSNTNTVPVWKSIAKQLTLVDQYFYALTRYVIKDLDGEGELFFGVSGILKINKTVDSNQSQEIHLSDANTQLTIPVPKLFYRIIYCGVCIFEKAAVIIHNDPEVPDSDRVCPETVELEGWEAIRNTHRKSGLTYVCRVTKKIEDILGSKSCKEAEFRDYGGINLNHFCYAWKDTMEGQNFVPVNWIAPKSIQYEDVRYRVNRECDSLFDTRIGVYKY